ncbi:alpha-mannosidase [Lacrimispora sp.]|uniref:alpha-mannosidase n=1 Tax=Lacrimispora sp. TaxID=2719234 RepID=UPI0028AFBDF3|nr:alpha-mannosidase [Lacrimispora sp.]
MFLTHEKLTAYTKELWDRRYEESMDLFPLASRDAGCETDEVIVQYPGQLNGDKQVRKGDFFIGRDRYLWLQTTAKVPEKKEGSQVTGVFDFGKTGDGFNSGFESLLFIDGKPYQGVDTFHNEVVLEAFAGKNIELTFLLWTGLEGGGVPTDQIHCFKKAGIGYLNLAADRFYYHSDGIVKSTALMPDTGTERGALLEALDGAFSFIDWDRDRFYPTVKKALENLEEQLARMPKNSQVTVHCVGHTHIDVAWLWRLKHTHEKAVRSFSTALRLMEQNDDFLFLQSQPQLYQFIKQDCPEIYEQIKNRIAEGRWEVDGGMWLEADCNITSGEALVRQFLYGCNFIKDEFGWDCTHLWLPDVFGYSWALPQILKQCNIKTFATTKISWNDVNRMPHDLFWWRGIDGSEVLTYFITTPYEQDGSEHKHGATYNGKLTPFEVFGSWEKFRDKDLTKDVLISFGHGDGGGGVTPGMLKSRRSMNLLPGVPNVVNDTAGNYFEKIHKDMEENKSRQPVWDGELYLEYHRGTYTSQARNKKWNRKLEWKLAETEWLASQVMTEDREYPQNEIHHAWEIVLRNQFHDIIPGSSIHEVYQDSEKEYREADRLLNETRDVLLSRLVKADDDHWTLWNFSSFDRNDLVFVEEMREGSFAEQDGTPILAGRTGEGCFLHVKMGGLEMRTIRFLPGKEAAAQKMTAEFLNVEAKTPYYQIRWNEKGQLVSVYDRENEREVLRGEGNRLEIFEDRPMRYDAWDIDMFYMEKMETAAVKEAPRLVENNGVRAVIRFSYIYRSSSIKQDMVLYAKSRRIDFETVVDWHEDHRLLKAAFDFDVRATKASYDIQFGHVERPTHYNTSWDQAKFEVVGHKWADISDSSFGVSLMNDCKYGYSAKDSTLKISLLKSAKYPDTEADMGVHSFTYSLYPHAGTVTEGGTIPESINLNLPVGSVKGMEKEAFAGKRLLWTDNPAVLVDTVKKAEKEECLVVRIHETTGSRQKVGIKSDYRIKEWTVCNMLEQDAGIREAAGISAVLQPFESRSFKVWMEV